MRNRLAAVVAVAMLSTVAPAAGAAAAPAAGSARTWYVAPAGKDADAGSRARPFATLGKASSVARPGDTVLVRGGTYRLPDMAYIGARGTAKAWITFRAAPGERPVLDAGGIGHPTEAVSVQGRYVEIRGLEVRRATRVGIGVWGGSHVRIIGNTVRESRETGIYLGYDRPGVVTDVLVQGNTVTGNAASNASHTRDGGWSTGITASGRSSNVRIVGNHVFRNHGEGILLTGTDSTVHGNVVHDNFSVNLYVEQANRSRITGNFVYDGPGTEFDRYRMPAAGIMLANEGRDHPDPLTDLVLQDNVVVGGRSALAYWSGFGLGGGLRRVTISRNTFYGGVSETLLVQRDGGHTGSAVRNNVIARAGGGTLARSAAGAKVAFAANCWSSRAGRVAGRGDVVAAPQFVQAGGLRRTDYRLRQGSPCTGMGATFAGTAPTASTVTPRGSATTPTPRASGAVAGTSTTTAPVPVATVPSVTADATLVDARNVSAKLPERNPLVPPAGAALAMVLAVVLGGLSAGAVARRRRLRPVDGMTRGRRRA